MTDCSSIQGSTSSSSDVMSSTRSGVVPNSTRIRVVRLVRPNSKRILLTPDGNATFGFAVRGGKEFGTGFFVSKIDRSSEADTKGLRVGDQIIRVNGYHVDDAVHKELTQFISSQDRLTLKVRGVGMIPIKEKQVDPLTWHIVPKHSLSALTALDDYSRTSKEIRVQLNVAPRSKLGLGICKGPEWKPGIYVQFTKDYSVARDAGLRPGDQILSCNSIDFSDVLFSEAVAVMKSSATLEMIVKTGAGLDLFPGESSGYNSSASSVTGDQSPCWADQSTKRLSAVHEENWADRRWLDKTNPPDTAPPPPPNGANRTIIQLSENGTLINNTSVSNSNGYAMVRPSSGNHSSSAPSTSIYANCKHDKKPRMSYTKTPTQHYGVPLMAPQAPPPANDSGNAHHQQSAIPSGNGKIADICFVSRQSETKTVIVEVHQSANENEDKPQRGQPPPPVPMPPICPMPSEISSTTTDLSGKRPSSSSSSIATTSVRQAPQPVAATCLESAISEELKKRQVRRSANFGDGKSNSESQQSGQQPLQKRVGNPSLGGADSGQRHTALMDEFKRAHQRMFKNGFAETDKKRERQEELRKTTIMKDEVDHRSTDQLDFKTETNYNHSSTVIGYFPTPPPPPQFANKLSADGTANSSTLQRVPTHFSKRPDSPTPDYDVAPQRNKNASPYRNGTTPSRQQTNSIARVAKTENAKANGDMAELESIDSYQMKNPTSPTPRPPSMYFDPQNTLKKTNLPVSVTIGEYASTQIVRKEPSKFNFIATKPSENVNKEDNVSEMLRSELEMTLSRSNLKKRHENGAPPPKNLHDEECKAILPKSQSTNIEKLTHMLQSKQGLFEMNQSNRSATLSSSNRVTIGLPINNNNKTQLRKTESNPPPAPPTSGILKNGYAKPSFAEKSISFGN